MPTEKQRACVHPPSEIVFMSDVTICNHCYGILDENIRIQEEDKEPEIVAA